MKNYLTKDGVADSDLMRAARDMYDALIQVTEDLSFVINHTRGLQDNPYDPEALLSVIASRSALAKARGEI